MYYENLNYYEKYFVYTNIVITILFFIGIWAKREFTSKVNLKAVIVGFSILISGEIIVITIGVIIETISRGNLFILENYYLGCENSCRFR